MERVSGAISVCSECARLTPVALLLALRTCARENHGSPDYPKRGHRYGIVVVVAYDDTLTILTPTLQLAKIAKAS